jgi:hypothetical protein
MAKAGITQTKARMEPKTRIIGIYMAKDIRTYMAKDIRA